MKEEPRAADVTEMTEERNQRIKNSSRWVFRIGVAVIVLLVAVLLVRYFFFGVNHSPKKAAEAAFRATYTNCSLKEFQKATVFNEDCQDALGFDASEDLAVMEPAFQEMKEWIKETGETYRIRKTEVKTYDALTEEYKEAVTLFQNIYSIKDSEIIEVAAVTLTVDSKYPDEEGVMQEKTFEDQCWCFLVGKKWYAFPMLTE